MGWCDSPLDQNNWSDFGKAAARNWRSFFFRCFLQVRWSLVAVVSTDRRNILIFERKDGVWRWIRGFVEGLRRPRSRIFGIAGSAGSHSGRLGEHLVSRPHLSITRWPRMGGFVRPLGVARGWHWRFPNARRSPEALQRITRAGRWLDCWAARPRRWAENSSSMAAMIATEPHQRMSSLARTFA